MYTSDYQGGPFFEIFTPQGSSPLNNWKVVGAKHVKKVYDREVKGYIYSSGGGLGTKLQLPKDERRSLSLKQPVLVAQLLLPSKKPFSMELSVTDGGGTRRRLYFSTAFSDVRITPLHSQVPLSMLPRDIWLSVVIDVAAIVRACFAAAFRTIDSLALGMAHKLRRLFTLQEVPTSEQMLSAAGQGSRLEAAAWQLPPSLDFPAGTLSQLHLLDAAALRLQPVSLRKPHRARNSSGSRQRSAADVMQELPLNAKAGWAHQSGIVAQAAACPISQETAARSRSSSPRSVHTTPRSQSTCHRAAGEDAEHHACLASAPGATHPLPVRESSTDPGLADVALCRHSPGPGGWRGAPRRAGVPASSMRPGSWEGCSIVQSGRRPPARCGLGPRSRLRMEGQGNPAEPDVSSPRSANDSFPPQPSGCRPAGTKQQLHATTLRLHSMLAEGREQGQTSPASSMRSPRYEPPCAAEATPAGCLPMPDAEPQRCRHRLAGDAGKGSRPCSRQADAVAGWAAQRTEQWVGTEAWLHSRIPTPHEASRQPPCERAAAGGLEQANGMQQQWGPAARGRQQACGHLMTQHCGTVLLDCQPTVALPDGSYLRERGSSDVGVLAAQVPHSSLMAKAGLRLSIGSLPSRLSATDSPPPPTPPSHYDSRRYLPADHPDQGPSCSVEQLVQEAWLQPRHTGAAEYVRGSTAPSITPGSFSCGRPQSSASHQSSSSSSSSSSGAGPGSSGLEEFEQLASTMMGCQMQTHTSESLHSTAATSSLGEDSPRQAVQMGVPEAEGNALLEQQWWRVRDLPSGDLPVGLGCESSEATCTTRSEFQDQNELPPLQSARSFTPPVIPPSHVAQARLEVAQLDESSNCSHRSGGRECLGGREQLIPSSSGPKSLVEPELELVFDPILNCYYDTHANQYYALR